MKKIWAGGILLFNGVILFLGIYIPAAIYASRLTGWTTPPGRLGTALGEMGGTIPFVCSILMMILGIIFILWESFSRGISHIVNPASSQEPPSEVRSTDNPAN
ncbi:hypothetical protein [Paenibacillus sp. J2TS4]|uniref:hypothetical protein n=1 Tax=Paenibacillus sp. J2TS4 TaxID=2807194 RepID=UPI001B26BD05|nr:hypothetical protein [Paenibacillus sp. J2TS4]GIP32786.1 hypothetical protein J2TS4_19960 [Paenibacillus sp. J2TS4]